MKMRNNNLYLWLAIFTLVGITIGYAVLNTTLNINGKSNISKNTWDVYFDNIIIAEGSVEASAAPTISNKTTVDFEVQLNLPGDYYEFTVDVVNDGTIDAMVDGISKFPALSESQAKYLNYDITYENGQPIADKELVRKESSVKFKVRVELRKDIDPADLPEVGEVLNLKFTTDLVQADSTSVSYGGSGTNVADIQFTIESFGTFYADAGMSWEQWIQSSYNTKGFSIAADYTSISLGSSVLLYNPQGTAAVTIYDKVINGVVYKHS